MRHTGHKQADVQDRNGAKLVLVKPARRFTRLHMFRCALALPYLHRGPDSFPTYAVPSAIPADEAIPRHLAVLQQVRCQCGPIGQLAQVRPLLSQHLPGHPMGRAVHSGVGHHVAPLQRACRFRSATSVKRILGHMLRQTYLTPFSTLPLVWVR